MKGTLCLESNAVVVVCVTLWGSFATSELGLLAVSKGTVNSDFYLKIRQANIRSSVLALKLEPF